MLNSELFSNTRELNAGEFYLGHMSVVYTHRRFCLPGARR